MRGKNTFTFQKNSLLKKAIIEHIIKLLSQLYYLRSLAGQAVLAAADEDVAGLKQRISEARESVVALEFMVSEPASADVKEIRDIVDRLREENIFAQEQDEQNVSLGAQMDDAIRLLQKVYRTEIK